MNAHGHPFGLKKETETDDPNQRYTPDLYTSSVARVRFETPLSVLPGGPCDEGDVVLVRVREVNTAYPTVETPEVNEVVLERGQLVVGVLGNRKALRGFSGKPPLYLHRGASMHLLNKGGVMGECTAFNRDLGWPAAVDYVGTVARDGRALNLRDDALAFVEG